MPQPYRGSGHICIHPEVLLHRPRIGALVAESLNAFSRGDAHLANLFAATLKAEEEIALDLFLEIASEGPRNGIYELLFRRRLSEVQYQKLGELRKRRKELSGFRNLMAHGIWALSDDCTAHQILIIDSKSYIRWHRFMNVTPPEEISEMEKRGETPRVIDPSIVTEQEVEEFQEKAHDLSRDITLLVIEVARQRP